VGNNGTIETDYTDSIANRTRTTGSGAFRFGEAADSAYADFSQALEPVTSYAQGAGGGGYIARAGDTLQSIAQAVWGDASLWYLIAQANGLGGQAMLIEGQSLILPSGVMASGHSASTFKPYDAASALGDTSPTSTKPVLVLTRLEGRDAIRAQRADALAGQARPPSGYSLDEFPFASSQQGGTGARIAQVPILEQNIQGGMLSSFYQKYGITHGDPFKVIVIP
jgi:hypothetical protein